MTPNTLPRIVCHFSCGAASAVATKLAVEAYPAERLFIVNAYIAAEHSDNRRFLADCEKWFGLPVHIVQDHAYDAHPYNIFIRTRFTKSHNGTKCSKLLKADVINPVCRPTDVHVLGYTVEERDRADRWADANNGTAFLTPLIDQHMTKADCLGLLERAGIELPLMYRMGYNNANCIGCVKGGAGYWNKIRVDFPAVFADMVRVETLVGPGGYLFRNRATGERFPLTQLPPDAGKHDEPHIECSAFCEAVEDLIDIGGVDIAGDVRTG